MGLLLLLTAAQLPLPPVPPARPTSKATAEAALKQAEANREAALAAEQEAHARASAAAAKKDRLAAARVAAAVRLAGIEKQSDEIAQSLATLAEKRRQAEHLLEAKRKSLTPLLPLLERISLYPAATLLAVPEPPEQALRGVLVLRGIARRIEAEAAQVREQERKVAELSRQIGAKMSELAAAEKQQREAAATLDASIAAADAEEVAASGQADAAARAAALAAGREKTLRSAIAAIIAAARRRAEAEARRRAEAEAAGKAREKQQQLALAQPAPSIGRAPESVVAGVLASRFGAPTAAGPATGVRYATAPGAHVFAPCAGLIEFAAPFRSYGRLVILDCGHGNRFVLAGMQKLLVHAGAQVAAGDVLGVMANWDPATPGERPTLYLELHHGEAVVDPLPFLRARG